MVNVPSSLHDVKHAFHSRMPTHAATATRAAMWLAAECVRLPARGLLALLWLYQRTLSPALPVIFGPSCGCRFAPTCSHYAVDAVREHGALFGGLLALRRLIKCTPLHPGGFDPVPARGKFSCTLIAHSPSAKTDPRIA